MQTKQSYPFYIKTPMIMIGLFLFFDFLYILQDVMKPLAFALIIAILLNPLYERLLKFRLPQILAISISISIGFIVIVSVGFFLSMQLSHFTDMMPQLKQKSTLLFGEFQKWLTSAFNISPKSQTNMISQVEEGSKKYIGQALGSVAGILGMVILIPVYVFLLLLYKKLLINFFYEIFENSMAEKIADIHQQIQSAIQSYLVGLMIEMAIVATLNSVSLLLIGVQSAILLGVIGAILNVIPYVGGIIGLGLPLLISLVTTDGLLSPALVVGTYILIQFIDNHYLIPKIVSSKVSVNAIVSIVVVLMGGMLWGVSGMFLSIPFVAIVKIIFDQIKELKPWGKLLGDDEVLMKRVKK